jgi:hypothetical protein
MAPSSIASDILAELVQKVAVDSTLIHCLEHSFITEKREQLVAALQEFVPDCHQTIIKDIWRGFNSYCR